MFVRGDKTKPEYEVEIDMLNLIAGRYERCWEYVHADSAEEAKSMISWIYGSAAEIVSVNIFE